MIWEAKENEREDSCYVPHIQNSLVLYTTLKNDRLILCRLIHQRYSDRCHRKGSETTWLNRGLDYKETGR